MISVGNTRRVRSDRVAIHAGDIHLKRHRSINQTQSKSQSDISICLRDFISRSFSTVTLGANRSSFRILAIQEFSLYTIYM